VNKKTTYIIVFSLILILYFAFFGDKGFYESMKLKREYDEIALNIKKVKKKNIKLEKEADLIENESSYVEKKAREVLGLVRDDEIIYPFND
jgi:cell division protein FtsB